MSNPFVKAVIGVFIRHILVAVAGILTYIGVQEVDANNFLATLTPVLEGLLFFSVTIFWSVWQKFKLLDYVKKYIGFLPKL